ncbi:MAG: acyl-ACP--UDP-N-acetylglucosamine O-acyltransferase [Phycisphaerae bacterium]|nr:acyl-ACP--UDP-N-acetylglucosamine O-acyltransferase [Phycisphaerae bacterium]
MAKIHPTAVVDKGAVLDPTVVVGPHCVIGKGVQIGAGTVLGAQVVIEEGVLLGRNNHVRAHCAIGGRPQILSLGREAPVGGVIIGDHNVLGEQVTIHCSPVPGRVTRMGSHNFLMVGSHLGHDCTLEDRIVLTNFVQLAGHCHLETGVWLSGLVGLHQFVTVGRWAYAGGMSVLTRDVPPFVIVCGSYPTRVRGVNTRGLRRAGMSVEQQQRIIEAYRRLYRRGGTLLENARRLAEEQGLDENVRAMTEAIERSSQHRFGRYLESFRHARS